MESHSKLLLKFFVFGILFLSWFVISTCQSVENETIENQQESTLVQIPEINEQESSLTQIPEVTPTITINEQEPTVTQIPEVVEKEPVLAQIPEIVAVSKDVTTNKNNAVELSVNAEISDEGTLSYQWYYANDKLSDGIIIEKANKPEYSPDVSKSGSLYYYCNVTNTLDADSKSVITPFILVNVLESINAKEPVISVQPKNVIA